MEKRQAAGRRPSVPASDSAGHRATTADRECFHEPVEIPGETKEVRGVFERNTYPEPNPVLGNIDLPLSETYYPLGFTLAIATNSEDVLEAARESWGAFPRAFAKPAIELRVGVLAENPAWPSSPHFVRSERHLIAWLQSPSDFSFCDMKKGFGFCRVGARTAANRPHLRYYYLEAMAYTLLEALYLTPIHAACVALHGQGLLLCGESEAGKSSLAYACARGGWTFVSDDVSYLVRGGDSHVLVGNPHLIRLREPARDLFPELRQHPVILRGQGDRAIELATKDLPNVVTAPHSPVRYILLLNRQPGSTPQLTPFSKAEALRQMEQVLCLGEQDLRDAQAASLRRLLSAEVFEFRYSSLDAALPELRALVESREHPGTLKESALGYHDDA